MNHASLLDFRGALERDGGGLDTDVAFEGRDTRERKSVEVASDLGSSADARKHGKSCDLSYGFVSREGNIVPDCSEFWTGQVRQNDAVEYRQTSAQLRQTRCTEILNPVTE